MRMVKVNIVIWLYFSIILITSSYAGVYTSTKHGTDADRSVVTTGFPYTTKGLCAHCHEMHASFEDAEMTPPAAEGPSYYTLFQDNFGASTNELCYSCHETFTLGSMPLGYGRYGIYQGKTKFNNSIHFTSPNMLWSPDPSPPGPPFSPTSSLVDAGNCHNCHNPHGYDDGTGNPIQQMLFAKDSMTGDSPAYELGGCEACHDGTQAGASKNIQAQLNKAYAHPTHSYNNRHTLPETGVSEGGSSFGPTNRHAECVDCHNPHTVNAGTHTPPGNSVSNVLFGVWGVEPTWPSIWTQPTSFTVLKPPTYPDGAQYEYQICFKCHSYYGLGSLTNGVSSIIGPSGTNITDQAWEFNPNNKSAHPVVVSLNNQTGSYSPRALASSQMSSPWDTSVGTQTMYCSDCHGADDEGTGAVGPHGSAVKFMLKGTAKYWPYNNTDGKLWTLGDVRNNTNNWSTDLFCVNCHPIYSGGTWKNAVHQKGDHNNRNYTIDGISYTGVPCVTCHLVVPHGGKRSRLIAYGYQSSSPDVQPYIINTNVALLRGFKKNASAPGTYDRRDCYSTASQCSDHNMNAGGYDP
jgi:cytochrome c553